MLEDEVSSVTEKLSNALFNARMYAGSITEEKTVESPNGTLSIALGTNDKGIYAMVFRNAKRSYGTKTIAIMSVFYNADGNKTYMVSPRSSYDTRINNLILKNLGLTLDNQVQK